MFELCGDHERVELHGAVNARLAATREALAAGCSGSRMVADASELIRAPAQREAFVQYEHVIDRRGLLALEGHAQRRATHVTWRITPVAVQRLAGSLDLRSVQPG